MLEDADRILEELGSNTYVKVPSIPEGFKAMMALSKKRINITATAVYTPMPAFLAAKSGAAYAAPYINRIDNMGYNGIQVAKNIHDIFCNNGLQTEVLAANFKNSQQLAVNSTTTPICMGRCNVFWNMSGWNGVGFGEQKPAKSTRCGRCFLLYFDAKRY